jgi:GNAT superfamily N-acetyltransferase
VTDIAHDGSVGGTQEADAVGGYSQPHKLAPDHVVKRFRCGQPDLDEWLERYAAVNQRAGMATVFVTSLANSEVVGYYALSTGGVEHENAPRRVKQGVARHPVPVVVLTRLAVHEDHQGRRLGRGLLLDALRRIESAADEVGIRALLLHAKDEEAKSFYMHIGEFEPSPTDPLHLFLLMKDLRATLRT